MPTSVRKPNRLLELLARDGDLSLTNLKRRYRLLCKEAHPDLAGRHEAFLALNAEYREALAFLRANGPIVDPRGGGSPSRSVHPAKSRSEARIETLDLLRSYTFKFYTRDSAAQLAALVRAASAYDPKRVRLLLAYKDAFLDSYHSWLSEGRVYYAHALLIHAIRHLFHYFDSGSARHGLLLSVYLKDLRDKAAKLEDERRRVLDSFASWIEEEAEERPNFQ